MADFGFVSVGRNLKRYTHNFDNDNNSTYDWGGVQPVYTLDMEAKDTMSGKFKDLIRLAPLPCPSFARIYKEIYMRFVPYVEVCPFYECIRSKKSYSNGKTSFVPVGVPTVTNELLVLYLIINHCNISLFEMADSPHIYSHVTLSAPQRIQQFLKNYYSLGTAVIQTNYSGVIYADAADFILNLNGDAEFITCRLTQKGKRLRKIFLGLGYSLNINDKEPLSILPLLAYYKAYFDTYSPQRETNWLDTSCYNLIQAFTNNYVDLHDFNVQTIYSGVVGADMYFNDFMEELSETFYTSDMDFVSAHRKYPLVSDGEVSVLDVASTPQTISNDASQDGQFTPVINPSNRISNFMLEGLRKLTRFVSKDSVVGQKLSDWLKVHYGAEVANDVFKDSYKIAYYRIDCSINDIFSTSDTSTADSGELLGAYAGKGIGFRSDNGYKYTAPSPGIVVGIACMVPEAGYFQGNDINLYKVDNDSMFFPEWDAMGFEITSYNALFSDNGIATQNSSLLSGGFGYIPRYSGYKFKKNIVNGDMSRRSTLSNMSPYYLDRIIVTSQAEMKKRDDGKYDFFINTKQPPQASEVWRYSTKYPYLGNYNRIFYNSGSVGYSGVSSDEIELDDNFISQMHFETKLVSLMKPVSRSYDTFDEDDNNSIKVENQ